MRSLLAAVLMMAFSFAISYFLPWWSISVVCFAVALSLNLRAGKSFLIGFLSIFILWLSVSLLKDIANQHILSIRMAQLFKLNNPILFMVAGAIVGGLAGGLSALSGSLTKNALRKA